MATDLLEIVVLLQPDTRIVVNVERSMTVAQLRRLLRGNQLRDIAHAKRIMLVAAGRVMQDGQALSSLFSSVGSPNSLVVHCVLTDTRSTSADETPAQTAPGRPSIAPVTIPGLFASQNQQTASPPSSPQQQPDFVAVGMGSAAPPPTGGRGFDRLRILGLDEAEVTLFRQLYLPTALDEAGDAVPLRPGETEAARVQRVEEHWMARQDPRSEFGINLRAAMASRSIPGGDANPWRVRADAALDGDAEDGRAATAAGRADGDDDDGDGDAPVTANDGTLASFMFGFAAGYFAGIIAVVCLFHPHFSRRFKNGLWLGVVAQALVYWVFFPRTGAGTAAEDPAPTGFAAEPQPRNPMPPEMQPFQYLSWVPDGGRGD